MKVSISREAFSVALADAASVAAARTPKPILQCVLLRTVEGVLVVMATDLETGLRIVVPQVEVVEPGEAVVLADKLASIVRESQDETLHLETDERVCHIRGSDSHFQMFLQEASDYPPVAELEGEADVELPAELLSRLIAHTVYAAAKENTRFAINGLLWDKRGKSLRLVATDGRRLALAAATLTGGSAGNREAIVPVRAMTVLSRILGAAAEDARAQIAPNRIVVQVGLATVSSILTEGHFPRYEDVIPTDNDKEVELNTGEFLRAIRRAALLTTHESRGVRFSFREGELELTSRAPEQGEAQITMPLQYNHEPLVIGFNPGFLTDALKVVDCETVQLLLKEPNRPGLLHAGKDFTYVVMPVNLS